mmetsp:Transcript_51934/g.151311  ORF Transcript_51934/g.151311 Transcript_51934/m.151311 type:complete len:236 (-) Transcript_51934:15-722(-)
MSAATPAPSRTVLAARGALSCRGLMRTGRPTPSARWATRSGKGLLCPCSTACRTLPRTMSAALPQPTPWSGPVLKIFDEPRWSLCCFQAQLPARPSLPAALHGCKSKAPGTWFPPTARPPPHSPLPNWCEPSCSQTKIRMRCGTREAWAVAAMCASRFRAQRDTVARGGRSLHRPAVSSSQSHATRRHVYISVLMRAPTGELWHTPPAEVVGRAPSGCRRKEGCPGALARCGRRN